MTRAVPFIYKGHFEHLWTGTFSSRHVNINRFLGPKSHSSAEVLCAWSPGSVRTSWSFRSAVRSWKSRGALRCLAAIKSETDIYSQWSLCYSTLYIYTHIIADIADCFLLWLFCCAVFLGWFCRVFSLERSILEGAGRIWLHQKTLPSHFLLRETNPRIESMFWNWLALMWIKLVCHEWELATPFCDLLGSRNFWMEFFRRSDFLGTPYFVAWSQKEPRPQSSTHSTPAADS